MGFDPESLRMRLVSVHPGVEIDQVREATGFDLLIPGSVPVTAAPTSRQLSILRDLDTDGLLKGP
jgi:acyl CoA:acetate/3-ketoacid CoA transferase beta subunit